MLFLIIQRAVYLFVQLIPVEPTTPPQPHIVSPPPSSSSPSSSPSSPLPSSAAAYIQAWVTKICTYLKMNSPQTERDGENKTARVLEREGERDARSPKTICRQMPPPQLRAKKS